MLGEYANVLKAGGIVAGALIFLGGQMYKVDQTAEAVKLLTDLNTKVAVIDTTVNQLKIQTSSFTHIENTEALQRDINRLETSVSRLSERVDKLAEKIED